MITPNLDVLDVVKCIYNVDQLLFGKEYIREMVRRLALVLDVKYVLVGHATQPGLSAIQTDFLWSHGDFIDNVAYDLKGTPCENVLCGTRVRCHAEKVAEIFPEDTMLAEMGAESYVGAPFFSPDGSLVGLLVILDDKPLKDRELYSFVVEFFAARIGTEYYRQAFEDNLQRQVNERTSELQEAFENLKRAQRSLVSQEKLATMGRVTVGIAHELKNPLNVIINAAEILEELLAEEKISGHALTAAKDIRRHGERANSIITAMLRQARQEPQESPVWVNISEMMERTVELCVRSILNLDFKPKLKIHKNLAPGIQMKTIDSASLERGFLNFLDNALYALREKYESQNDQFQPELWIELSAQANVVRVLIKDNGIGISESSAQHIFDEFYTTKPAGDGTGLGLSIAKQVMEKNNGEIFITSQEGVFTEVKVEFLDVEKQTKEGTSAWSLPSNPSR